MPPQMKQENIAFNRQPSTVSTISATSVSTTADDLDHDNYTATYDDSTNNNKPTVAKKYGASSASIRNFLISLMIFVVGFYGKENFVPNHDEAYDRPHPFQTTRSGDVILNFELNHPLVYPASVPSKLLHRTCVYLPLLLTALIYSYSSSSSSSSSRSSSSWNCRLAGVSALLTAVGICELLTHILKYYVLRRRPNFYALCEWDGTACTAPSKKILESQLSFPSGHSSIGWCGMTFLVLVLLGKMRLLSSQHHKSSSGSLGGTWKVWTMWLVCLFPWSWAAYVAASRIADKWHHASDVITGTLLGILCATVSYHSVFPHVLSMQAGTSYAELEVQKNR